MLVCSKAALILAHPLSICLPMAPFGQELFHSCPQAL